MKEARRQWNVIFTGLKKATETSIPSENTLQVQGERHFQTNRNSENLHQQTPPPHVHSHTHTPHTTKGISSERRKILRGEHELGHTGRNEEHPSRVEMWINFN